MPHGLHHRLGDSRQGPFRGSSSSAVEIELEAPFTPRVSTSTATTDWNDEMAVHVAVGKDTKEGMSAVTWALKNMAPLRKVVLLHVHCRAKMIPMSLGGWFPADQLSEEQLHGYRLEERKKMEKTLDKYSDMCGRLSNVQVQKLVIEMDDIAKGLIQLISENGITRLVMGAATEKHFSTKMKAPKSRVAVAVAKDVPPSCRIWFVCRGFLICLRESEPQGNRTTQQSPKGSISPNSNNYTSQPEPHTSQAGMAINPLHKILKQLYRSDKSNLNDNTSPSPESSHHTTSLGGDDTWSNFGSSLLGGENESPSTVSSTRFDVSGGPLTPAAKDHQGALVVTSNWFNHLQEPVTEADSREYEAFEEFLRRRNTERELLEANIKARELERKYAGELKLRRHMEGALANDKMEIHKLKKQLNRLIKEIKEVREQKVKLEAEVLESGSAIRDLQRKLNEARKLWGTLQKEQDNLQDQDDEHTDLEESHCQRTEVSSEYCRAHNLSEFSALELAEATHNFDNALKIGDGRYGTVYIGFLRHTMVAIKVPHCQNSECTSEFCQEVEVLSRLRHPNLVLLIGACLASLALIFEFLPGGSLQDRLTCAHNAPPISWQARIRISAEICSALVYIHSHWPKSVVHGNLKPANILLDANLVSKLSDFGISRLIQYSTSTIYHPTDQKGSFIYMDPEFVSSGELTTSSDTYSFGIILLQLLTGKPPIGVVKEVQQALDKGKLYKILDPQAGKWPLVQAKKLAYLGLRCCEMSRKNRPDLVREVWTTLEAMRMALLGSSSYASVTSAGPGVDGNYISSYLTCPIFQVNK